MKRIFDCIFCGEKGTVGKRSPCAHQFYNFGDCLTFYIGGVYLTVSDLRYPETILYLPVDLSFPALDLAISTKDWLTDPHKYFKKIQTYLTFV